MNKAIHIEIPDDVKQIMSRLEHHGFEAYVVGGCVRDSMLGLEPHDWDVCTSARPEQIKQIFSEYNQILSGEKHGTVSVIMGDSVYEITTFRSDGQYSDHRHPDGVIFQTDVREDLLRRDFTINAMAYSESRGLIDPYGGAEDIRDKVIYCVGNPEDRLKEDPLRILRALRFAVRYGFQIEQDTYSAMLEWDRLLCNISIERVNSEVSKILQSNLLDTPICVQAIMEMLACIEKALDNRVQFKCITKLANAICNCVDIMEVRLALMCDYCFDVESGCPVRPDVFLAELRFSNRVVQTVSHVLEYGVVMLICLGGYVSDDGVPTFPVRRLARIIGVDQARMTLFLVEALQRFYGVPDRNSIFNVLKQLDALEYGNCVYKLSQLAVNGDDIMRLGHQGKQVGAILELLLMAVMDGKAENKRDALLEYAKSKYTTEERWKD